MYYGTASRTYGPPLNVNTANTCTLSTLSESATYYFAVTAYDTSGNESGFSTEVSKTLIDGINPVVALSSPTSGGSYATGASPLTVKGTATDNVGVTRVAWSNDRGGSGTGSGTGSWTAGSIALSEGTNTLTFTAEDVAGNRGSRSLTVTYTAPVQVSSDQVAPTV
ncbi:MAG: Ig-like domain-containing protein, partial [Desulfobacterales bacterium]